MCAYPQYEYALTHWKRVLRYCDNCPCINILDQETDNHYLDTTPSIRFHIYHISNDHGIFSLKYRKLYRKCKQESSTDKYTEIYTIK